MNQRKNNSPNMVSMQSSMAIRAWTLTPILCLLALHFEISRLASHWHDYDKETRWQSVQTVA